MKQLLPLEELRLLIKRMHVTKINNNFTGILTKNVPCFTSSLCNTAPLGILRFEVLMQS